MLEKQVADLELAVGVLLDHVSHPFHYPTFIPIAEAQTQSPLTLYINRVNEKAKEFSQKKAMQN